MATATSPTIRKLPPCRKACPAQVNVQAYVSLIERGKYKEAVDIIRQDLPFPAICGRVCFSPCEDACSRKNVDQSVAIRHLKKFVADMEKQQGKAKPKPVPKTHKEKVAIVGAGPAGLTVAYQLAKLGYPVTVFERMAKPGGMMRYCIPEFRLEKSVVDDEIEYIKGLGVQIKTGVEFGRDVTIESLKKEGYKATFLAVGAWQGMKLGIPGEDMKGVIHAVDFLRDLALGKAPEIGKRVIVVGGGNSAMDAARAAKRLGAAQVTVIYRRSRQEMPALPLEIKEAEEDGVKIDILVAPKQIIGDGGKVKAIECLKMKLGEPDESGRRRPVPIPGSEYTYEADTVIPAIGQLIETSSIPKQLRDEKARVPIVPTDPYTLETKMPGVFAGGDVTTGPASIIEAVGQGKRAAESLHLLLTGQDIHKNREENIEEVSWVKDPARLRKKDLRYEPGEEPPRAEPAEVAEIDEETERRARFEAFRCLGCGPCAECLANTDLCEGDKASVDESLCIGCNICVTVCPFGAVEKNEENIAVVNEDLCKGCGICAARCPTFAITMKKITNEHIEALALASTRRR